MSISFISETGPFIWTLFFSSIKIDSFPSSNSISIFIDEKKNIHMKGPVSKIKEIDIKL